MTHWDVEDAGYSAVLGVWVGWEFSERVLPVSTDLDAALVAIVLVLGLGVVLTCMRQFIEHWGRPIDRRAFLPGRLAMAVFVYATAPVVFATLLAAFLVIVAQRAGKPISYTLTHMILLISTVAAWEITAFYRARDRTADSTAI